MPSPRKASAVPKDAQYERVGRELLNVLEEIAAACASQMELSRPHPLTPAPSAGERAGGRAALKSVRAIPNPRPEDRRPRSELIATPAEQQPIESGHSRNSDFGLLSGFGLRPSDFRAAEQDLPSTGRTLEQPWGSGNCSGEAGSLRLELRDLDVLSASWAVDLPAAVCLVATDMLAAAWTRELEVGRRGVGR